MNTTGKVVWVFPFVIGLLPAVTVRDHRDPSRGGGAYRLDTSVVFEMTLDFTAGQTRTCETRNLTPRADPVLHLLAPKTGSGVVNEVARDDDSAGNLNARFTFRAPTAGKYRLVMRASWSTGQGTADLYCDGRVVWLKLPVGGAFKRLEGLRAGETLTTVPLRDGGLVVHRVRPDDQATGLLAQRVNEGITDPAHPRRLIGAAREDDFGVRAVIGDSHRSRARDDERGRDGQQHDGASNA